MGLESLGLQMIPWCFHVVAGSRTSPSPAAQATGIRLIGCDGRVRVYHRPVAAAELMKEHPCHLVCRSDAFFIGQKVPPLAAGDQLQPGHSYFLLPAHFFRSVLSFVTLATSLIGPNAGVAARKTALLRPFDIHKTASGTLQIRVSDEFLRERVREEEICRGSSKVVSTEALEKEYRTLVRCRSRRWRPKLETITESERRRVVGPFGGFRRRKTTTTTTKKKKEEIQLVR
ncbi:uncharacterized protein LOC135625839 [Musa acuminata AAA Group]|uniref:uncharacterized protein LOC104000641 n=1 Tax=Musa acuminata AAA Group TaxID=214697 RepID=UPI0031DE5926